MNKYKIAFFIEHVFGGGAERVIVNLASSFADHGHKVVLITTIGVDGEYRVSQPVIRYILEENGYGKSRFIGRFRRFFKMKRILKKENPDVLISFLGSALYYGIFSTRFCPIKSVISVRNDPDFDYSNILKRVVAKIILPLSEGAVFQTKDAQKWFPYKMQKKSCIIFNPIKESFYNVEYQPIEKLIVSVGRLTKQKNQTLLIDAFASLAMKSSCVKLYIYGDGELYNQLDEKILLLGLQGRIVLKGRFEDIPMALSKASIFVLSSDFEGAPNALMEAMAVGVACISTDCPCGGPKMIINHNKNGILVPVGGLKELEAAISDLLSDSNKRISLGKEAKKTAESFRTAIVYDAWNSYLKSIL